MLLQGDEKKYKKHQARQARGGRTKALLMGSLHIAYSCTLAGMIDNAMYVDTFPDKEWLDSLHGIGQILLQRPGTASVNRTVVELSDVRNSDWKEDLEIEGRRC